MSASSWVIFLIMVAVIGFVCYKRGCRTGGEIGFRNGYQAAMTDHFNAQQQTEWTGAQSGRMITTKPMITEVERDPHRVQRAEAVSGLVNMGWSEGTCRKPVLDAQAALQSRGEPVETLSLIKEVLKNHASAVPATGF